MKLAASLMFAKSLILPKTDKKSSARKSLFGAMICIGLSIIPLIVVISITNGIINGMTERIINLSSSHIQAYVASGIDEVKNLESFTEYGEGVKSVNGVKNVYPEIDISALAAGKTKRSGIEVRAVDKDIFHKNQSFNELFEVLEGNIDDFAQEGGKIAVVGSKMAEELGLNAGDTFKLITTRSRKGKITPKLTIFKVGAIVSSGYQELDQFWVFIPLEAAYSYLSLESASYHILVETEDPYSPELVRIQRDVQRYFGHYANVYRWEQIHTGEFENFSSTKVMLVTIMMLIVLVASVNISSAIVMLVMERRKEIAILKSVGATPGGITFSFVIAGFACCFGGVLIGLPIGLLFSVKSNEIIRGIESFLNFFTTIFHGAEIRLMDPAYYLAEIPIDIPFNQIFIIIFLTFVLSIIVSIIPARKAGKEKPLELFRKN